MSEIVRADTGSARNRQTPFEFDGTRLDLSPDARFAAVTVAQPVNVVWTIRRGTQVIWRSSSDARQLATVELPLTGMQPGTYKLEATAEGESRSIDFVVKDSRNTSAVATLLSFNANLAPALRFSFVGHQWLLRGKLDRAMGSLQASLENGPTREALIEIARVDAYAGRYDQARERLRGVLRTQPNDFDALSVLAYVEVMLQDYPVAAELYRRALAVQDSPALRLALSKLPQ